MNHWVKRRLSKIKLRFEISGRFPPCDVQVYRVGSPRPNTLTLFTRNSDMIVWLYKVKGLIQYQTPPTNLSGVLYVMKDVDVLESWLFTDITLLDIGTYVKPINIWGIFHPTTYEYVTIGTNEFSQQKIQSKYFKVD